MNYGRCQIIKEWPEWDYAIHTDKAQIARQGRAMTYPFSFTVDRKKKTAKFSSTSDLPFYETSLSSCTCYDFQDRHLPCKHMYRLAVQLRVIKIINRRHDKERLAQIQALSDPDNEPEQIRRKENAASCVPIEIDFENKSGIFQPKDGAAPYKTTLQSCTCRDYDVRRLPCKHIYRLRFELEKHQE